MSSSPVPTTTLRPDPGTAALWSAWSGLLVAAGVWFVVDTPRSVLAWGALTGFVVVAVFFLGQLAWPSAVEVRLTHDEVQARAFGWRTTIPWEQVHVARVGSVFGDPALELHVREPATSGDPWQTRIRLVPLPVGTDQRALHAFLAARLGTGGLRAPGRLEPL